MSQSKYTFLAIADSEIKGKRLDFSKAQENLANYMKPAEVEAYYNNEKNRALSNADTELHPDYPESWPEYTDLAAHSIKTEAWRYAGEMLISTLAKGECRAFIYDHQHNMYFLVPLTYWSDPGLSIPHGSLLNLQSSEWQNYSAFNGVPFFLLEKDLKKLKRIKTRLGRPPKYDRDAFEKHLLGKLDAEGTPQHGDQGWETQKDVVEFMLEWCSKNYADIPKPETVRRHVGRVIAQFKDTRAAGKNT